MNLAYSTLQIAKVTTGDGFLQEKMLFLVKIFAYIKKKQYFCSVKRS